jgi:hypothetical protein
MDHERAASIARERPRGSIAVMAGRFAVARARRACTRRRPAPDARPHRDLRNERFGDSGRAGRIALGPATRQNSERSAQEQEPSIQNVSPWEPPPARSNPQSVAAAFLDEQIVCQLANTSGPALRASLRIRICRAARARSFVQWDCHARLLGLRPRGGAVARCLRDSLRDEHETLPRPLVGARTEWGSQSHPIAGYTF